MEGELPVVLAGVVEANEDVLIAAAAAAAAAAAVVVVTVDNAAPAAASDLLSDGFQTGNFERPATESSKSLEMPASGSLF